MGTWRRARAGVRWCLTGPERPRIASLQTWWWDSALARSRPELPAGLRDSLNITSSSGSKKNSEPTLNMLEQTSDKEFELQRLRSEEITNDYSTSTYEFLLIILDRNW